MKTSKYNILFLMFTIFSFYSIFAMHPLIVEQSNPGQFEEEFKTIKENNEQDQSKYEAVNWQKWLINIQKFNSEQWQRQEQSNQLLKQHALDNQLISALRFGQDIEKLLEKGASPDSFYVKKSGKKLYALDISLDRIFMDVCLFGPPFSKNSIQQVKLLVEFGADVTKMSIPPLYKAVRYHCLPLVDYFLDQSGNPNNQDFNVRSSHKGQNLLDEVVIGQQLFKEFFLDFSQPASDKIEMSKQLSIALIEKLILSEAATRSQINQFIEKYPDTSVCDAAKWALVKKNISSCLFQ